MNDSSSSLDSSNDDSSVEEAPIKKTTEKRKIAISKQKSTKPPHKKLDESDDDNDDDDEEKDEEQMEPASDSSSDNDEERTEIRSELSQMSFEDLMKLKQELGTKVYNEAVFGDNEEKPQYRPKTKADFKRDNKNRPREMTAKRPVPLLGLDKSKQTSSKSKQLIKKTIDGKEIIDGPRDPRFDPNCGEFDSKKFKENFSFVSAIKDREILELSQKLQHEEDPREVKRLKYLVQRMKNQKTEEEKLKIRQQKQLDEKQEIQKARKEFRKPYFKPESVRRTEDLVKQFVELKNSGKLDKHLEKRRKKNTARDRKKFSFD